MKIFIGKIPPNLFDRDIQEYFATFGEIRDFNFKGNYAFVEYESDDAANAVLENRDHNIRDSSVIVEKSFGRKRTRVEEYSDDISRRGVYSNEPYKRPYEPQPRYREYDPYQSNYEDRSYGSRGGSYGPGGYDDFPSRKPHYDERFPSGYDNRRRDLEYKPPYDDFYRESRRPYEGYPRRDERDSCPYCSKCGYHGSGASGRYDAQDPPKKFRKDHPNDINKIVIENVPSGITKEDVEDFVRNQGFEVVFVRITLKGDSAIVELNNIGAKEEALKKLDGLTLKDTNITVRSFKTKNSSYESHNEQNDDNQSVDIYSGIDNVNAN